MLSFHHNATHRNLAFLSTHISDNTICFNQLTVLQFANLGEVKEVAILTCISKTAH